MKRCLCDRRLLCLAVLLLVITPHLCAQAPGQSINGAGTLADDYKLLITQWIKIFLAPARTLFWLLAGIEFSWVAIQMALQRADFQDFAATFVRKLMWIGIFYILLVNGVTTDGRGWIPSIIDSFSTLGKNAAGLAWGNPDVIVGVGVNAAGNLIDGAKQVGFVENTAAALALLFDAVVLFLAYLGVAIQFVVTLVESFLVVGAGFIFLGFGGSRWTAGYTERYIATAVSIGFKLLMVYLITGAGMTLSTQWVKVADIIATVPNPSRTAFDLCAAAVVFVAVAWKAPGLAAGILGGHSSLSGGDVVATGTAIASAAVGSAAIASGIAAGAVGAGGSTAAAIKSAANFVGDLPATVSNGAKSVASSVTSAVNTVANAPGAAARAGLSAITGVGRATRSVANAPGAISKAARSGAERAANAPKAVRDALRSAPQNVRAAGKSVVSATQRAWQAGYSPSPTDTGNGISGTGGGNGTSTPAGGNGPGPRKPDTQATGTNSPYYVPPPAMWKERVHQSKLAKLSDGARKLQSDISRLQPPHDGGGTGSAPPTFGGAGGGHSE